MAGRPNQARAKILDAAAELFYAEGIQHTGIDSITTRAGVAKMSLYNNFASKEELIATYIEHRHEQWLDLYRQRAQEAQAALDKVLAVFDAYLDHAQQPSPAGFKGCGLLNAGAELAADSAGRAAVARHKQEVEDIMAQQLLAAGEEDAQHIARLLSFILEGAVVRAGLEQQDHMLREAKQLAQQLVAGLG